MASLAGRVHSVAVVSDAVFCVIKGEISLLSTVFGINNRRGRQAGRLNALQKGNKQHPPCGLATLYGARNSSTTYKCRIIKFKGTVVAIGL